MNDPGPMPGFLDRTKPKPLVGSYSLLNTYKNCPHQMRERYLTRKYPFVGSPESKWGDEVHKAMELRVGGQKPLPVNMAQWERFAAPFDGRGAITECQLGITAAGKPCGFFDDGVWFRGKVDVTLIKGAVALISDWKTGGSKYEDPFELECCALLVRARHLECTTIKGQYVWLKENRVGQLYDVSDARTTFTKIRAMMDEIAALVGNNADFEKRKSGLCPWCPVKDCEHWRERT